MIVWKKTHGMQAAIVIAVLLAGASASWGQGFGPRFGLTSDPDQVHLGLHLPTLRMSPHLGFMVSFEAGVGDDTTLFSGNFDFKYVFSAHAGTWHPYMGGGPALHLADHDQFDDQMEVGLGIIGGMQTVTKGGGFFAEMRIGVVDSPDLKFTVGWMFR